VDWNNTNHLLQALLVAFCGGMLVLGYHMGNRQ
jgi:hypothetical protein